MTKRVWKAMGIVLAVVLVGSISVAVMAESNPEEAVNTLRVYGRSDLDAAFPYDLDEDGYYDSWAFAAPFDLTDEKAPPKDFVVWNPAYLWHFDTAKPILQNIRANWVDANQKVFLRHWYVPELAQPLGEVWTAQASVKRAHIVMEYTYLLLNADNNPVAGWPGGYYWQDWWGGHGETSPTAFVFPLADRTDQIGLDSLDANDDGTENIVSVAGTNRSWATWGEADLNLFVGPLSLTVGDEIQFLDHKVVIKLVDADHNKVVVDVYYTGRGGKACGFDHQRIATNMVLDRGMWPWTAQEFQLSAGRHNVLREAPEAVTRPWYFQIDSVVGNTVVARAGRLLNRGEAFFVDGAEYAVAAINTEGDFEDAPFRYITLRNPLPKERDVTLDALTVDKCAIGQEELIPFLPPFNQTHDIIDDVNIPNNRTGRDVQYPDNVIDESCTVAGYGAVSGILCPFNTVAGRRVTDQPPALMYYVDQDVEGRFDTSLAEARFTEPRDEVTREAPVQITEPITYTPFVEVEQVTFEPLIEGDGVITQTGPVENANYDGTYFWDDCDDEEVYYLVEGEWTPTGLDYTLDPDTGMVTVDSPFGDGYEYAISYCYAVEVITHWYGPTSEPIVPCDAEAEGEVPEPGDVIVTAGDAQVVVFGIDDSRQFVDLGTDAYDGLDIEITYCYWGEVVVEEAIEDQKWQWIDIKTNPDAYTEFVLPQWDNALDGMDAGFWETGDYILVSSFLTEDSGSVVHGDGAVRVKFAFDAEVGFIHSADVYVNDAEYNEWRYGVAENSLRLYGRGYERAWEQASSPYDTLNGPFDVRGPEAPPKDFLVWNPAYFSHWDFPEIVVNDRDANQKVFLRQWYVPDLAEPLGQVWTGVAPVESDHIIKEYTYVLLDVDDHPMAGEIGRTAFKFPVANWDEQLGLDSFDVNNDGEHNRVNYTGLLWHWTEDPAVLLETDILEVREGDELSFLDHRVVFKTVDSGFLPHEGGIVVQVFYDGFMAGDPASIEESVVVLDGQTLSAGRHTVLVFEGNLGQLIQRPWLLTVDNVTGDPDGDRAYVTVGRWLMEDESFFVDGLEYYVSKLGLEGDDLKYISLRNPLCKGDEELILDQLSVIKTCIPEFEHIPFLPPFNMTHDIKQDVGVSSAHPTGIWVEDRPAVVEYYIDETKEPRFDTNLLEEKFTIDYFDAPYATAQQLQFTGLWQWINIETRPWHYTEFVLPDIVDGADYLLVSSWMTEDSTEVWYEWAEAAVRMMFEYDALDGTGIYVNTRGVLEPEPCIPAEVTLTAEPMEVVEGEVITFTADATGTAPFTFEWDFGDEGAGTLLDGGEEFGVYLYAEPGTYTVTVTVENECGVDSDSVEVVVLEFVEPEEFHIFLPIITNNFTP